MKQQKRVAIGLGANLGEKAETLRQAVKILSEDCLTDAVCSRFYESPPWGGVKQPDFLNAVVVGNSEWKPHALLNFLKDLEIKLGRVPGVKNGPRHLDLDLLAYGEEHWDSPEVVVPHPRMHERDFVLLPLFELWPHWRHPVFGKTCETLLEELAQKQGLTVKGTASIS